MNGIREEADITLEGIKKLSEVASRVKSAYPSVEIAAIVSPLRLLCLAECFTPEEMPMLVWDEPDVPDTTMRFAVMGDSETECRAAERMMRLGTDGLNVRTT